MKTLSNYTEKAQTLLFKDKGVFFAFSDEQFNEQKKENVEYVSLGAGMICPKENAKDFLIKFNQISEQGIKLDMEENGKDKIIYRELCNYECFYVGDATDAIQALKRYNFSENEIMKVYRAKFQKHVEQYY